MIEDSTDASTMDGSTSYISVLACDKSLGRDFFVVWTGPLGTLGLGLTVKAVHFKVPSLCISSMPINAEGSWLFMVNVVEPVTTFVGTDLVDCCYFFFFSDAVLAGVALLWTVLVLLWYLHIVCFVGLVFGNRCCRCSCCCFVILMLLLTYKTTWCHRCGCRRRNGRHHHGGCFGKELKRTLTVIQNPFDSSIQGKTGKTTRIWEHASQSMHPTKQWNDGPWAMAMAGWRPASKQYSGSAGWRLFASNKYNYLRRVKHDITRHWYK